ncbi:MAG: hypothetical protein KC766_37885, partial [Myxococcales bacterium]|nr:hypothetical protein [Myxococcales bacterium]
MRAKTRAGNAASKLAQAGQITSFIAAHPGLFVRSAGRREWLGSFSARTSDTPRKRMLARSADTELFDLRKLAESQANTRRERVTSAHLLAAIALREGPAAVLLHERGLSGERLLRAARSSTDEIEHPLRRALQNARDVASRMGAREPGATHLLVALLNERKGAAHKAREQCGIDVSRLRIAAMNVGLGLVGRRRIVTRKSELEVKAAGARAPRGVAIPLFPPAPKPRPEALPLAPRPTPTPPAPPP